MTLGDCGSWTVWAITWQPTGPWRCPAATGGVVLGGSHTTLLLCCFTHWRISYRTSPAEKWRISYENAATETGDFYLFNSCPPELGQRRLKSSLVRRHKALPFISNRPFSGRRSEYSFWAQWSHRDTSSLSHRDGLIPGNNKCIISNQMCLQKVLHMCTCSYICN